MKDEIHDSTEVQNKGKSKYRKYYRRGNMGDGGAIYGMGFIGALIYFIQHAATFWDGVLGVIKAIFWPGVLIYKLLEYLKI